MALSLCSRLLARHNNQLAQGHNSQSLWCRCLSFGHGRPQHMQSVSRDDCLVMEWQRLEKEAQVRSICLTIIVRVAWLVARLVIRFAQTRF
ncbi:hypothetical protein DUNSADRAFT_5472 [Dunaliella salina]|uniref:Encoded protein n=1 Tax=Dunaliella salina TaxID=3046 RepID=A0ABQ7FU94_DUNSA|nr:hypothetical protein DUNSADRAFT_5472 [Dunaliella salina]|eukprot:KAF5825995.1 hypothetical protein DUNSADRAFT_5472 [Dunaliella salina]